ncbi:MAG: polyprenyl synthetase family protein [Thermoplasmatales archaeon]|nr:MAG: polyprenyl synthetase family protein [Thermoplasmatales archaeon]
MVKQYANLDEFFDATKFDIEDKITKIILDGEIVSILNGGKRLRSLLAALAFKACTRGKETEKHYQRSLEGSVSIELAHGASLVHDDIIDKDKTRRGKDAVHVKQGVGKAILTGHKMLVKGFDIALSHGKEVASLYVDSWNKVVNGEIDEVDFNKSSLVLKNLSTKSQIFEAYNKIIDLKTAVLFSSACKAGAIEADMKGDILNVFANYGREIGLAYQLADDLVDLAQGEMIDSVIIPLLNKLDNKAAKLKAFRNWEIKRKFSKHKDKIQELYISEIKRHIDNAIELSKSSLIPQSDYKKMLTDAPNYIINKMLGEIKVTV